MNRSYFYTYLNAYLNTYQFQRDYLNDTSTMADYYLHVPSPTERGGLTAKEILYAQMPCYFGLQDCTTGKQYFNG